MVEAGMREACGHVKGGTVKYINLFLFFISISLVLLFCRFVVLSFCRLVVLSSCRFVVLYLKQSEYLKPGERVSGPDSLRCGRREDTRAEKKGMTERW